VPALAAAGTVEVLGALFHTEMFRVFYTTGPHSSVYECTKYSRIFVYEYEEYEVFFMSVQNTRIFVYEYEEYEVVRTLYKTTS